MRLKLTIYLDYDAENIHGGEEEKTWFDDQVLGAESDNPGARLVLHSNLLGMSLGCVTVLTSEEVSP